MEKSEREGQCERERGDGGEREKETEGEEERLRAIGREKLNTCGPGFCFYCA